MHRSHFTVPVLFLCLAMAVPAQNPGPDVIVGELSGVSSYGSSGGIAAFSVGTTSCNVGTQPLNWFANVNQHPVIAQNMYRIKNDRFEQIGISWLKHGFAALTGSLCDPCNNPGTSQLLGVGCSDPYGSGLNGSQSGLGPRFEVNAATGAYPYPFTSPSTPATIGRRLQVHHADLDPAQNPGAVYFVEGHYVTPDDAAAGNHDNNASYRPISVSPNGGSYTIAIQGATTREKAAIWAWSVLDPDVSVQNVDIPGDGRMIIALKRVDLGGGQTRYNYALHNLNSDRCARSFAVAVPPGTSVSNLYFHDVDYHSGEPFAGTDWAAATGATGPSWSTVSFASNPNANALRWGTCYSFGFDANDEAGAVTIGLFKPGAPASVTFDICPPQPQIPSLGGGYTLDFSHPYDYVDITAVGQPGPSGDDSSQLVNLGFSFTFFGIAYTQLQVSSNGYLAIPGQDATVYTNQSVPNASTPNGVIAGFWDDLNPNVGGVIRHATVGTAPNRRFVVHYDDVPRFGTSQLENLEIIVEEDGDIVTTIIGSASGGSSATRGIEDATGATGLQYTFNVPGSAVPGTSLRYQLSGTTIPHSAELTQIGDGSAFSFFGLRILSTPNQAALLMADLFPGPTVLPAGLGTIDLGFSPVFVVIADGSGQLGPPAITDECGLFTVGTMIGASTLPSGYTVYFQGIVGDPNAPNGFFHLTNPLTFVAP